MTDGEGKPSPEVLLPGVAKSSAWSFAGQGLTVGAAALATPLTVRLLGSELYGLVALVHAAVANLGFADLGMGMASTRFAARAHARQDSREEVAVVWTALAIGTALAAVVASVVIVFSPFLVDRALHIPRRLHSEAVLALRIASLGFIARVIAGVLNTSQLVRLRWDLFTVVTTLTGVGQVALVPVVVALGGGVVAAVMVGVVASITAAILHLALSARLQPLLWRPQVRGYLVSPLLRFGGALLLSSVAAVPLTTAERFFVARFASVEAVGHYALAATLAATLAIAPSAIAHPLVPAFTNMLTRKKAQEVERLCRLAIQATLVTVIPLLLVLWLVARPMLNLAVGPGFAQESTALFYILSWGLVLNSLGFVPTNLLLAGGRADIVARLHLLEIVPFLLVAGLLTVWLGPRGAALAWVLRVAGDTIALFLLTRRALRVQFTAFGRRSGAYVFSMIPLLAPFLLLVVTGAGLAVRVPVVVCSLVGHGLLLRSRVLTREERAALWGLIRRLTGKSASQHVRASDGSTFDV